MLTPLTAEQHFSVKKWNKFYKKQLKSNSYKAFNSRYYRLYHKDIYKQVIESYNFSKKTVYLEIGCGHFFLGQALARECGLVIGIDYSFYGLQIAKKLLDEQGIKNYLLIEADITNIPIKNETIDFIYGGGVIEHFKNTQACVDELYRVLKKKGVSFNTVPHLNLGALSYRQLWGNIPNFPVLKQLAEIIHIKILKGAHMTYGYEFSFPKFLLVKIHERSGFKKVSVEKLKIPFVFEFLPSFARNIASRLAETSPLFWPMVKVIATK